MVAKDREDDNNIARRPKEAVWFTRAPNIMVDVSTFDGRLFTFWFGFSKVPIVQGVSIGKYLIYKVTQMMFLNDPTGLNPPIPM